MQSTDALVMFGITGDLAKQKLYAALHGLARRDALPPLVIGVAGSDMTTEEMIDEMRDHLDVSADDDAFERLSASLRYISGDYENSDTYQHIEDELGDAERTTHYLAVPPSLFEAVVAGIGGMANSEKARVVVEKPFGNDLESAKALAATLADHIDESNVFRIDHFLGKEEMHNVMVVRYANSIIEPVWNRNYIDNVQITMAESFGVDDRGSFYDSVGTIRDVVQNHLLQLVALLAMEAPISDDAEALRNERVRLLSSIRPLRPSDVAVGQLAGFRDVDGVAGDSTTETYVEAQFEIDNWRWAGVPWFLRTGKSLPVTVTEAVVEFRRPPTPVFADQDCATHPNHLRFRFKPDSSIELILQTKTPGDRLLAESVVLQVAQVTDDEPAGAYQRLLHDAMIGDHRFFARQDGVEAAWKVVDAVTERDERPETYRSGTWPELSDRVEPPGGWHPTSAETDHDDDEADAHKETSE